MATLACSLPDLEASSEGLRIVSSPSNFGGPVVVTVMETNRVDLLFITFNTMRSTNIISVDPCFSRLSALERSS
jgi:hypothetical protein